MIVPGIIVSLITFPGVVVHELAHQICCRICKVPVFKVVYFQMANPTGYVLHETTDNHWHQLFISTGPFLFNTLVGGLIALPASLPVFTFDNANIFHYLLIYLGVSIAMHAFPSTGDAGSIWQTIKRPEAPLLFKILATPIVGVIYLGALGSMFWLDLAYGIAVAIWLPKLFISLLA